MIKAYWSPDSDKIAFVDRDNRLYLMNITGENIQETSIVLDDYITRWYDGNSDDDIITQKIIWKDNQNIIISIPRDLDEKEYTQEDFYNYNINENKLSKFLTEDQSTFTEVNILTIKNEKALYFTSDGIIYRIDLE